MDRISGERVEIRPPTPEDARELLEAASKSSELHEGLVTAPGDEEAFYSYLERNDTESNRAFLVIEKSSGKVAGVLNLSQIFYGPFCNAYLGYYLFKGFTGRGLMTEALELLLRYVFKEMGLHRLEANIQPHNDASVRLVERVGFVREGYSRNYLKIDGEWRDHERWAAIREDFEDIL